MWVRCWVIRGTLGQYEYLWQPEGCTVPSWIWLPNGDEQKAP